VTAILLLLQAQAPGGLSRGWIIQLVLIVAIFYFVLVMPQRREAKRHREMLETLRPGDAVVTSGGLIGEIVQLKAAQVTLKTGAARVGGERSRIARQVGQ
jgi:preprotein translocase subunit YajC